MVGFERELDKQKWMLENKVLRCLGVMRSIEQAEIYGTEANERQT